MMRRVIWRRARRAARVLARAGGVALAASLASVVLLPFPRERLREFPAARMLTDRDGHPLRLTLGPQDLDCRPLYRAQAGDRIAQAIVAVEDKRFWSHAGVDPIALARAAVQDLAAGRVVSGASTLSEQLIRLSHPRPRTLPSKMLEALEALRLERAVDKVEILSQYLNRAPFGSNIVGIEAAAWRYFGKRACDLSLAEAALLAGLPQAPSRLRPDRHPERARRRQAYVLERMLARGDITAQERSDALAQPLALRRVAYPFRAPHFCELVEAALGREGEATVTPGGAVVRTTLDAGLQRVAEEVLRRHAPALAAQGIAGGAVVILDVASGAVRALVGSPDFFDASRDGQVNGAVAARSAGSTLKPFAYALAFDRGLATPQTVLADVPARFRDYDPANFDGAYRGLVPARDALILSLNMPSLEIEQIVGQPLFHATLRRLGLATLSRPAASYGAGLVLGNGDVRLLDLVNAYACLARGGVYRPYVQVEGGDDASDAALRVFSPEACWLVADALGGDERAMDATGHAADVRLPPLAWKTGTSSAFRDAWTVGFNPDLVIGLWLGNPDGAPAPALVGPEVAAPIAWEIFRRLYPDNDGPWFTRPPGLTTRDVCAVSGAVPGPHCARRVTDWCIAGVSGTRPCAVHRNGAEDAWPPEIAAFLNRQRAAPRAEPLSTPAPSAALRILSPAPGSHYRVIDGITAEAQRISLSAASAAAGARLHWFVNDRYLGDAAAGAGLFWPLQRGHYHLVCADGAGHSDGVEISVE